VDEHGRLRPFSSTHYEGIGHINILYDGKQKHYVNYLSTGIYASKDGIKWNPIQEIALKPYRLTRTAVGNGKLVAIGGTVDYFDPEVEKLADRGVWRIDSSGAFEYNLELGKFPLTDVVWTGNSFFAIGYQGLMMTSRDGLKWQKVASPTQETLSRIIKANETYYVVGSKGLILESKDLTKWKKHKTPVTSDLYSIAWDGRTLVAVGQEGVVLVSDNGSDWTKVKNVAKHNYTDVTWGKGTFLIVSPVGSSTVFKSSDGRKWSSVILSSGIRASGQTTGLFNVMFTGDVYVALGREGTVLLSSDAVDWQRQDIPRDSLWEAAQVFNGKLYVFGYDSEVYYADL